MLPTLPTVSRVSTGEGLLNVPRRRSTSSFEFASDSSIASSSFSFESKGVKNLRAHLDAPRRHSTSFGEFPSDPSIAVDMMMVYDDEDDDDDDYPSIFNRIAQRSKSIRANIGRRSNSVCTIPDEPLSPIHSIPGGERLMGAQGLLDGFCKSCDRSKPRKPKDSKPTILHSLSMGGVTLSRLSSSSRYHAKVAPAG